MKKIMHCSGLLESFLSKKRFKTANRLVPENLRRGRILDIGCGAFPYFLSQIQFNEKYGLDKVLEPGKMNRPANGQLKMISFDLEKNNLLPFPDQYFEVVVMLAVLEHIELSQVNRILREIFRILIGDGVLIITVPSGWTHSLLRLLAAIRIVSPEQIKEHKQTFNKRKIRSILKRGGFSEPAVRIGHFEFFMNTWALAKK